MESMIGHDERMRHLVDAGIALTSSLSLDELLQRIAATAATLTGARYAALGVIDERGSGLERFITHGVGPEVEREIGHFPVGRGILGVLIRDAKPLRLHDLTHDARSVGFPPGHPAMQTFLGVPIVLRGIAYGNLYLTMKEGGEDFTAADEEIVVLLAAQAAVAIENARLFATSKGWIQKLESLAEVGNALASEIELTRVFQMVVERVRDVVDCRLVLLLLPREDGTLYVEAGVGEGVEGVVAAQLRFDESKAGRVMQRKRSVRVDSIIDDPEFAPANVRVLGSRAALLVPLLAGDQSIGVLAVHDKNARGGRFADADLRLVEMFADRASVAIQLSRRVARDSLKALVRGQELERKRFARELHDETGQALAAILLGLATLKAATSNEEIGRASDQLRELAVQALDDVRRLAVEIRPKALDDFGLVAAVERLAMTVSSRSGIHVDFEASLDERLSEDIEAAIYRMVQEALTNVVRHAEARRVSVVIARHGSSLSVVVDDEGRGFETSTDGNRRFGLSAMRERIGLIGGTLLVESAPGRGTTLRASIPVE